MCLSRLLLDSVSCFRMCEHCKKLTQLKGNFISLINNCL